MEIRTCLYKGVQLERKGFDAPRITCCFFSYFREDVIVDNHKVYEEDCIVFARFWVGW